MTRILLMLIVLLLLVGCTTETEDGKERTNLYIYIDPENGCEYLAKGGQGGIYPRMDREGKQICSLPKESEG